MSPEATDHLPSYAIITPAYNEDQYLGDTIRSVVNQNHRPLKFIIMDDRSSDQTAAIAKRWAEEYDFVECVEASDSGIVEYGTRVAHVVNQGMEYLPADAEVVVKLDADVSFAPEFFERIMAEFRDDPQLGIASGRLVQDGKREQKGVADNTRGATKCYRASVFRDMNGLFLSRGWDVMDDVFARSQGWYTRTIEVLFDHNKEEGRRSGLFKKHLYTGLFTGRVPYYPPFLVLKLGKELASFPWVIGSFIQFLGYLKARFVDDHAPFPPPACTLMRQEQKKRFRALFGG